MESFPYDFPRILPKKSLLMTSELLQFFLRPHPSCDNGSNWETCGFLDVAIQKLCDGTIQIRSQAASDEDHGLLIMHYRGIYRGKLKLVGGLNPSEKYESQMGL